MNRRLLQVGVVGVALAVGGAVTGAVLSAGGGQTHIAGPSSAGQRSGTLDPHPIAGSFRPDGTRLADCGSQRCYEQAFGNIAYSRGPKAALALFARQIEADPAIEAGCHRIAHTIGSAMLARDHGNIPEALAACSSICWSGYCLESARYDGLGTVLGTLHGDAAGRRAACGSFTPRRYLDACLRGAGVPVTA